MKTGVLLTNLGTPDLPTSASAKSAKLYQKIWTENGSPLRVILEQQIQKLDSRFRGNDVHIIGAMHYGKPSIKNSIHKLCEQKIFCIECGR